MKILKGKSEKKNQRQDQKAATNPRTLLSESYLKTLSPTEGMGSYEILAYQCISSKQQ